MTGLRVLRIHHAGGSHAHRARDRALRQAGVDVTLVAPAGWPGQDSRADDVPCHLLPVRRAGDVNRHAYADVAQLRRILDDVAPDVVDVHEEPVSLAARQWLRAAAGRPVVMYSAQNLDKRWPPPFAQYERAALRQVTAFYPCSAQAASVLRGKGYRGRLEVLPLGVDTSVHRPGDQALPAEPVVLGLVGRLVPQKGVRDAVQVLARVRRQHPARLVVVGDGPEAGAAQQLSAELGVAEHCSWLPWSTPEELAALYRQLHVLLVPSRATPTWVEQFGRVVTEGRAGGAVAAGYASGSLPEVVGDTGLIVPPGDVDALADAVTGLLADPPRWHELRDRGLAATPSWESVAQQQAQLYAAARAGGPVWAHRASRSTREQAVAEFGPPARTPAGVRPFAVPVLREPGVLPRVVAAAVDVVTRQR